MRSLVFLLMFIAPAVHSADGRLTKPAKEVQRLCFAEAGIPVNNPNHTVTEEELDAVLRCTERYIDRS